MAILDLQALSTPELSPSTDAPSSLSLAWCDSWSAVSLVVCSG